MLNNEPRVGNINLNLLHTFFIFAELKTVSATASKLGRSQPAISARLHTLEEEVGAQLLERCGRGLVLTPLGRIYYQRLSRIFLDVRDLLEQARASTQELVGTIRIGALPTTGVYILAPKIAQFQCLHEDVDFEIQYGFAHEQLVALRSGNLDLVVGVGDPPDEELDVGIVGEVRPVLVRQAGSPGSASPNELFSMEWIAFENIGDPFFDATWKFLREHGLDRRVRAKISHIQSIKALIMAGAGVALLPDYTVVEPELESHQLKGLDFTQPIWVAARSSSLTVPIIAKFRDEILVR